MSRDALVVGINTYQHLPGLQAPAQDAEAIAQQLEAHGEFRVRRLPEIIQAGQPQVGLKTKLTLRELEAALVSLFKPKGNNVPHTALFYFSGHGIQKEAGIQEGYLAVSDVQPEVGFYGLSLFWLRRLLQESPVRQRVIWLDCCHSGELLNFLEADPGARPGTDRLFMAASREYESAYESLDSPYSVFTQSLLTGLDPNRVATGIVTNHSLTDWVSNTLKGELQQPLFESSGSEIILTRSASPTPTVNVAPTSMICPYRGLEYFDEAHAEYFFGREDLTDQLLEKLRAGRFLAVVGASGSGKSSVVRAGLVAELRRGKKFSGSDRWQIKLLTPTEHPLKSLTAAFIDPDATGLERAEQLRRAETFLQDGGIGLAQLVRASLPTEASTSGFNSRVRSHLLLVIDQFEEVFTLCHGPQEEYERHHFFNCLFGALQAAEGCLSLVIVLRADFFSKCSLYEGLARQIEQNLVMVTPLSYDQIKSTIVRPAQKVGLVCDPNLVYTMLLDVIGAPGELPLLQYTLLELWQRRQHEPDGTARLTLDTYTELGGVRGTLQKRATEIFYSLLPEEQQITKRIFLALTQLGEGTEDTRRRILKAELISPTFPVELIERALEKLVAAKLVVTSQENGEAHPTKEGWNTTELSLAPTSRPATYQDAIDVAHEALIRNWPLLRGWLDENREMLRRQRRIERAAQEWHKMGQPMGTDYLLRGSRLMDAEDFATTYPQELSALGQRYLTVSQTESQRARQELRLLKIAIPSVLLIALIATFHQYHNVLRTQAEKEQQLQIATSRARAAIAQSILQEPNGDPMAALLISRLAVEEDHSTYEAQSSLRAVLQNLRLQVELQGHRQTVHRLVFSPDQQHLATASADGTIRLWSLNAQTIQTGTLTAKHTLTWVSSEAPAPDSTEDTTPADVADLAFNSTGSLVAAIAHNSSQVNVWSVETGTLISRFTSDQAVTRMAFSPKANWIAVASSDRSVSIWQAETGQLLTKLPAIDGVHSLQFSPDGSLLLTASSDGKAQLWRLTTDANQRVQVQRAITLVHPNAINSASFSPSGQWIATACDDGRTRLWTTATGQLHQVLSQTSPTGLQQIVSLGGGVVPPQTVAEARIQPVTQILFSPNEELLAVSSLNQRIWLWNVDSGQLQTELSTSRDVEGLSYTGIEPIAFSPDSRLIVTANHNQMNQDSLFAAHLWDTQTGQSVGDLAGHIGAIEDAQFSPDGTYVATADASGAVRLWAAELGGELPSVKPLHAWVQWAAFAYPPPDPSRAPAKDAADTNQSANAIADLVTVTTEGTWQHWIFDHATPLAEPRSSSPLNSPLPNHVANLEPRNVWQSLWLPIKRRFRALHPALSSNTQELTDSTPLPPLPVRSPQSSPENPPTAETTPALTGIALSVDGQLTASATVEGTVEIRQVQANQDSQLRHRIQVSPDHSSSAESSKDLTARPHPVIVRQISFSPDGDTLLGVGDDATVRLWDTHSGQILQILEGHQAAIQQASFSQDGQWIVTASADQTVRVWNATSGRLLKTLPQQNQVNSASFSPNGEQIVTASGDGTASVIDTQSGLLRVLLNGHRGAVLDARFSPDGGTIVTASKDGTARLWDAKTGVEQAQLRPAYLNSEAGAMLQAFFSPDGQHIAALAEDGRVYLWAATWEMLLKLARDRSLRQLTAEECIRYLRLTPNTCPIFETVQTAL
ncbi:caspase family protein [Oculatella sp. LEGE 06141]|uniref:nSTAND1 domain-containing NTPase n=1 Tax=Oculatella sp. LEGE 06141 TaxID=1828648 RepID=UPI00187ECFF4|nr:caspase family protein [Oculatella sp. LEGE 06141]MBE9179482.1 caspase family protein [Oculatella sp. LEGE 06141]